MSGTTHLTHKATAQTINPLNVTTFDTSYTLRLKLRIVQSLDEVCTFLYSHKHNFLVALCYHSVYHYSLLCHSCFSHWLYTKFAEDKIPCQ